MIEHQRIDPAEFQRCVALLARKIEALAVRLGVTEAESLDLEGTLAAFPPTSRSRADVLLEGVALQTSEADSAMAVAARYVRALANDVWASADHGGRCQPGRLAS